MLEETKNARVHEFVWVAFFTLKDMIQNAKKAALQDIEKDTEKNNQNGSSANAIDSPTIDSQEECKPEL